MAEWKYRLELKDLWEKYDNDEMEIVHIAKEVANRIRDLNISGEEQNIDYIARCFDEIHDCYGDNNEEDEQIFNYEMTGLYDWADENRVWVNTF